MDPNSLVQQYIAENGSPSQNPKDQAAWLNNYNAWRQKQNEVDFSSAEGVLDYLTKASKSDPVSRDLLFNYLLSEKSASSARKWEEEQNSKRYQVMVEDLKKAGLNPYWMNSLGGAASYETSGNKYSGSAYETQYRDRSTAQKNDVANAAKIAGIVGSAIAIMIALL